MNKPQLVSFFVYRRQSRDRFRIDHTVINRIVFVEFVYTFYTRVLLL